LAVELTLDFADHFQETKGSLATTNVVADKIPPNVLLHELQLDEQLNDSVVQTRRADFSLMLAMLAEDVREQSQFLLPQTELTAEQEHQNSTLRKAFNLPDKAPLALSSYDDVKQFNQAQSVVDNDLASIHLNNAMMPKPLAFRDDEQHITTQILDNTSLFCQLKHKQRQDAQAQAIQAAQAITLDVIDKPLSQPLNFNAKAWLDSIQQSLVKAPLLN